MNIQQIISDEILQVVASLFVGVTGTKVYFAFRKDKRDDRSGQDAQHGYAQLLDELQETVKRLGDQLSTMGQKLDDEIAKRYAVQEENAQLRLRVLHLEHVVRNLGGTV